MTTATVTTDILDPRVDWAIRRLSTRHYSTETRRQAFQRLAEWDGTPNCRVALQAIVSCAMQSESPLFTDAQLYLKDRPDHWIVSLQEASRSLEARRMINQELGDRGLMKSLFTGPHVRLWHDIIREDELADSPAEVSIRFMKWADLLTQDTEVLLPHPYPDERELWDACLMVQENLPDHMRLHEIEEILEDVTLMAHPLLQRRILLCLPTWKEPPEALATLLAEHIDRLWSEIERIIALGDALQTNSLLGYHRGAIAMLLKRGFPQLTDAQRLWLASQRNFWTWSVLPELVEFFQLRGDEPSIVDLLVRFVPDRKIEEKDKLAGGNLTTLLRDLPTTVRVAILETLRERQETFIYYLLLWLLPRDKSAWQTYYGPIVAAGLVDVYSVVTFLEVVGEDGKSTIVSWLRSVTDENRLTHQSNDFGWEKLVKQAIVPWGIPLGRWLVSSHNAFANFTKWGYQLKPEDLEQLPDPLALLPMERDPKIPSRIAPLPWAGWRSAANRSIFLTYLKCKLIGFHGTNNGFDRMVRSLLLTASHDAAGDSYHGRAIDFLHAALSDCQAEFPMTCEQLPRLLDEPIATSQRDWIESRAKLFLTAGFILWYARSSEPRVISIRDEVLAKFRERIESQPRLMYSLMEYEVYQRALDALYPHRRQTELLLRDLRFFDWPAHLHGWIRWFEEHKQLSYVAERLPDYFRMLVLPELLGIPDGRQKSSGFPGRWLEWAAHFPQDPEIRNCLKYYLGSNDYRRTAEQMLATPPTP